MPETIPHASAPAALLDRRPAQAGPRPATRPRPDDFRSRIGVDVAGGFYPAPHRYQVFLSRGCPRSLRVSLTLDLLRLGDSVTTVFLPSPAAAGSLRGAYEATRHRYDGPLTVPALCDRWSGRVVSNHTPDILRDLADHLGDQGGGLPRLRPRALAADIDALGELIGTRIVQAARRAATDRAPQGRAEALETLLEALDLLDGRLAGGPYALGDELTAADVDLWVALVHLDAVDRPRLAADAARLVSRHDRLRSYVRRLAEHPAFRGHHAPAAR